MLGKCAEGLALRKAFPKLLSGMYVEEEFDQSEAANTEARHGKAKENMVLSAITKGTAEDLEKIQKKLGPSKEYTPEQKKTFGKMINSRLAKLKKSKQNVIKGEVDDDIPVIES